MDFLTLGDIALRLGVALALGFALGLERERKKRPAGLRTMMLVSLGCAGFMIASWQMFATVPGADNGTSELTRVLQGVIQGIGFLGAGAIIQARGHVRGVTTAATVWVTAAVGIACGLGLYTLAVVVTVFALVTLLALQPFEGMLFKQTDIEEDAQDQNGR